MADIGSAFRALHRPGDPFTLMNVWDLGSAKVASALGAEALGTTSSGHAFTLGKIPGPCRERCGGNRIARIWRF